MEHAYNSGCMRTHGHQIQLDGGKGGEHKITNKKKKKKLYRLFIRASNEPEASLKSLQQCLLHSEREEKCEKTTLSLDSIREFDSESFESLLNESLASWKHARTLSSNIAGEYLVFFLSSFLFPQISFTERTYILRHENKYSDLRYKQPQKKQN